MAGSVYEVRVRGHVSDRVDEIFEGASVTNESIVRVELPDEAALFGLIEWIGSQGLVMLDVRGRR